MKIAQGSVNQDQPDLCLVIARVMLMTWRHRHQESVSVIASPTSHALAAHTYIQQACNIVQVRFKAHLAVAGHFVLVLNA